MVGEWFTDKFRNRGLLDKTPSGKSNDELTSGNNSRSASLSDYTEEAPPIIESDEYIEPSSTEILQKDLKLITSKNMSDVMRSDSEKTPMATLEASSTLTPSYTEDELMSAVPEEVVKAPTVETVIPKVSTQEPPKVETQADTTKVPEVEVKPVLEKTPEVTSSTDEKSGGVTGAVNKLLGYANKRLPTGEEFKESGKAGVTKVIKLDNEEDSEYARRGGYIGIPKSTLKETNDILTERNSAIQSEIKNINAELIKFKAQRDKTQEQYDSASSSDKTELRNELNRLDKEISRLTTQRREYMIDIAKNEESIRKHNMDIAQYEEAIRRGKAKSSMRGVVGKKLQSLGEGAGEVSSGVYDKTRVSRDWFGQKGFLAQPFKQANITSSVVQPVKTRMANLDAITRSTGSIVGRGMVDAVTTVRANKNISPFGTPGTIAGAKQQFEYNVPARKIVAADVKTNINPDIMPNIFGPKVKAPTVQQYTQVMQPDGTVMNVPIQQRQSKSIIMLVNRGVKHSVKPYNRNVNVGNIDVFKMQPIARVKVGSGIDITSTKSKHEVTSNIKKPSFDLKLVTSKNIDIGAYEIKSAKKTDRKQKQSENVTSLLNVGKNLNKLVSGKKIKKV